MGRLAIIEEDGGGAASSPSSEKTSKPDQPSRPPLEPSSEPAVKVARSNKKQGAGVSDESGYYEGDELQADDSIEILYDRKKANHVASSAEATASSAVSITPINVPTSTSQGRLGKNKCRGCYC